MGNEMKLGFNTFDGRVRGQNAADLGILQQCGGLDYLLVHFDIDHEPLAAQIERAKALADEMHRLDMPFIANFETQNFVDNVTTADGYDWANHPDGTHRLEIPKEIIEAFNTHGGLLAVMYDEFEHAIINRNLSILLASGLKRSLPVFPRTYTNDVRIAGENLSKQIREYADGIRAKGAPAFVGEHVFPVLYHTFARNGVIPNYKSQKECYTNVQFAIAAGAALEYGTPLFSCVDLWFMNTYPGHSPHEMYHNLLFNYLVGTDRVYVEACNAFSEQGYLTEYGKKFIRFAQEYRGKERPYHALDYKPEIGVIRYDDGFWGQGTTPVVWPNELLGNPAIKPKKENKEWIKIFRLITHGETGRGGLAWDRVEPRSFLTKHRSFVSMNGAAVFDDRVPAEKLESLKLCFLCGAYISQNTLDGVKRLVHDNGLTVVTPLRFAPAAMQKTLTGGYREIKDGKGAWIITNSFESPQLKRRIAPFLGEKNEMRFTFGNETVRMRIAEDGDSFTVI